MEPTENRSKTEQLKDTVSDTIGYIRELAAAGPTGVAGRGLEMGLSAALARTALRRLPAPLNLVAPLLIEKIIMKHGVDEGRELLLKGLYWIKRATDDQPAQPI
nr:hypothetical protein [uncultured Dyadobacter sp.]